MIIIDVTTAEHARGGIGTVIRGMLHALSESERRDDIMLLAGPTVDVPPNLRSTRLPFLRSRAARLVFQRILLPVVVLWQQRRLKCDVGRVILPDSYVPLWHWPGQRPVLSCFVHDVLPITNPEFFTSTARVVKGLAFSTITRHRPQLYTSSAFTRAEIRRELGIDATIVHYGCGQLTDAYADACLSEAPGRRMPYLVYVGPIEPRKDLRTLITGFSIAAGRMEQDVHLLVVGDWQNRHGLALRRWAEERSPGSVRFLGRRSSADALALIRDATALVYPSLAEGFGLPVLEALALGTPVIASALPAIKDWAQDSAAYFPPGDALALAEAVVVAVGRAPAATGKEGKELAAGYRWRKFAEEIVC